MPDSSKIVQSAMMLREHNPQGWDNFVQAMREYSAQINMEMVKANPDLLMRAQGMAICAQEIAMILLNAPQTFEKMRQANIGQPTQLRKRQ
jgi:hypothetical protein